MKPSYCASCESPIDPACMQLRRQSPSDRVVLELDPLRGTLAPSLSFFRRQRREQRRLINRAGKESKSVGGTKRLGKKLDRALVVEAYILLLVCAYLSVVLVVAHYSDGNPRKKFPLLFFPLELLML